MVAKTGETVETAKVPDVQVSGKVPAELYEVLENHRWEQRLSKSRIVADALAEYAKARKLLG